MSDFYSKINQMHSISNLFHFGTTLYMFLTVSPSIIRSLRLYSYIQHLAYAIQVLWLVTSKQPQNLFYICLILCVRVLLDSWWWTERPSETRRVLFQNKINWRYCASGCVFYWNILRYIMMHGPIFVKEDVRFSKLLPRIYQSNEYRLCGISILLYNFVDCICHNLLAISPRERRFMPLFSCYSNCVTFVLQVN